MWHKISFDFRFRKSKQVTSFHTHCSGKCTETHCKTVDVGYGKGFFFPTLFSKNDKNLRLQLNKTNFQLCKFL